MGHLWTKSKAPLQYIRLFLCRDVYHCTPADLAQVPWRVIAEDLAMIEVEREVSRRRSKDG